MDPDRLAAAGISLFQISQALEENNITFPAGTITEDGQTYPIRTTHSYDSLDEIRDLVVGFPGAQIGGVSPGGGQGTPPGGGADDARPVLPLGRRGRDYRRGPGYQRLAHQRQTEPWA